jgi:hypothetical protein
LNLHNSNLGVKDGTSCASEVVCHVALLVAIRHREGHCNKLVELTGEPLGGSHGFAKLLTKAPAFDVGTE